jgi:hypothetical protein
MKRYKLDPDVLHQVCQEVVGLPLEDDVMFQAIRDKLSDRYPDLITSDKRCWIGSRAGGILGKMTPLYAGMNEYLIIFGTPAGTQGYSGRYHFMQIWDFFLAGETLTCDLESGQIIPKVHKPGDSGFLEKGHSLTCEMKAGSWMLEYGRGATITALPFALMDSLMSSLDFKSVFLTMKEYTHFFFRPFR